MIHLKSEIPKDFILIVMCKIAKHLDSIKLSQYKGSLILLEFWFPYCKGSIQSIPEINNINHKY
jgi:hypothetical protein